MNKNFWSNFIPRIKSLLMELNTKTSFSSFLKKTERTPAPLYLHHIWGLSGFFILAILVDIKW